MKFSSLASELQTWLKQSIEQGCSPDTVERSMRASGYQSEFAQRAVAAAFKQISAPTSPPTRTSEAADAAATAGAQQSMAVDEQQSSSRILANGPNEIDAGDRTVHILMALNAPRVVLFGNLLAAEECEALIELSRGKLERSNVVDRSTGRYQEHPDRTSEGTYFRRAENELVARIEARIAELTGCPVEQIGRAHV